MSLLSKLTCGIIPVYYTDTKFGSGPASSNDLFDNLDRRAGKLRKKDAMPTICYSLALHAGIAGLTVKPKAAEKVMDEMSKGGNYGQRYQIFMNINGNGSTTFIKQDINESGILNFRSSNDGELVHTAYLHRTKAGEHILLHNNSLSLDMEMTGNGTLPFQRGGVNIYTKIERLQNFLDSGYTYHFTSASQLNSKVS